MAWTDKRGYLVVYAPSHPLAQNNGSVKVHRKKWYDLRGVIPNGWIVHHKDNDKTNNKISNLEVMSPSDHAKEHNRRGDLHPNPQGAIALVAYTKKYGPWNKGTAVFLEVKCFQCGTILTKPKWKIEFNKRRNMHIFCNHHCASRWVRKETLRKFWAAREAGIKI